MRGKLRGRVIEGERVCAREGRCGVVSLCKVR